jgi:hypothetical protein
LIANLLIKAAWAVNDRPVGSCSRHRSMANAASSVTRSLLPRSHLGSRTHVRLKPKARSNTFAHYVLGEQGAEKQVSVALVNCTAMASFSWSCTKLSHSCIVSAPLSLPVSESIGSWDKLECQQMSTPSTARTHPRRPTQRLHFGIDVTTGEQSAATRFIRPYLEVHTHQALRIVLSFQPVGNQAWLYLPSGSAYRAAYIACTIFHQSNNCLT